MTIDPQWFSVMNEAKELGISIVLLAGGEPFVRHEVLKLTKCFPEIIFLIFTNGLLFNQEIIHELKRQKNVVPVISMEGFEKDTDKRRGTGVYEKIQRSIEEIKCSGICFGASLTVTDDNFAVTTSDHYIQGLIDMGCSLFFFVEYIPVKKGTEDLVLTSVQREKLENIKNELSAKFNALFIVFPGNEKRYGGCLSAGRGFIHISPDGSLEPCPFVPYSDTSVKDSSLREALQSKFLMTIRNNSETLSKNIGSCVLWEQREWINSYLTAIKYNKNN
jgi:MoaA/NifB/PqqE/SkfB family radical SAM enzyme